MGSRVVGQGMMGWGQGVVGVNRVGSRVGSGGGGT